MSTKISIKYDGNLSATCVHQPSKTSIQTDAPPDNNGLGRYFSPTDLLATSLGTCMLTIAGIAATTHNIEIGTPEVEVEKIMASDPRRVGQVNITFKLFVSLSSKEKTIIERAVSNCPVSKSLHTDLIQHLEFIYSN